MRYGVEIVSLGPLADPPTVVALAVAAETAGYELVAVWDHLAFAWGIPSADALVTLSAVAQATERVKLLPFVMPLARHRPHVLAHQLALLDRLSGGRLVLGAGLGGVPDEFTSFGEPGGTAERAQRTDEALEIISGLWSGGPVQHAGRHFEVRDVALAPLPVQRPRPPIWIGGESEGALRRAARWDGWGLTGVDEAGQMVKEPAQVAAIVRRLADHGAGIGTDFEIAISGVSARYGGADPRAYAAAGVTWWLESLSPSFGDLDQLRHRVLAGPGG